MVTWVQSKPCIVSTESGERSSLLAKGETMRILFVYTNVNGFHPDVFSIGLASLMSSVKKAGHEIRLVIVREKSEYSLCYEAVKSFEPAVVGFSTVSSQFGIARR